MLERRDFLLVEGGTGCDSRHGGSVQRAATALGARLRAACPRACKRYGGDIEGVKRTGVRRRIQYFEHCRQRSEAASDFLDFSRRRNTLYAGNLGWPIARNALCYAKAALGIIEHHFNLFAVAMIGVDLRQADFFSALRRRSCGSSTPMPGPSSLRCRKRVFPLDGCTRPPSPE